MKSVDTDDIKNSRPTGGLPRSERNVKADSRPEEAACCCCLYLFTVTANAALGGIELESAANRIAGCDLEQVLKLTNSVMPL